MNTINISLEQLSSEVTCGNRYDVGINSLIKSCGASPVHVHFETDSIIVFTSYPEVVCLKSGNSAVTISQIQNIEKKTIDGKHTYTISCGKMQELHTQIVIREI